jgi:hypothetical protein
MAETSATLLKRLNDRSDSVAWQRLVDRRTVVKSIDTDPMTRKVVIDLTIDDMDDVFPAESSIGPQCPRPGSHNGPGICRWRFVRVADPGSEPLFERV